MEQRPMLLMLGFIGSTAIHIWIVIAMFWFVATGFAGAPTSSSELVLQASLFCTVLFAMHAVQIACFHHHYSPVTIFFGAFFFLMLTASFHTILVDLEPDSIGARRTKFTIYLLIGIGVTHVILELVANRVSGSKAIRRSPSNELRESE